MRFCSFYTCVLLVLTSCTGQIPIPDTDSEVPLDSDNSQTATDSANQDADNNSDPFDNPDTGDDDPDGDDTEDANDSGIDDDMDISLPGPTDPCGTDLNVDNGQLVLDFGDMPPTIPVIDDPLEDGPYRSVKSTQAVENPYPKRDSIKTTVYAPSEDGKTVIDGPFPLIMVLAGFSGQHPAYVHFTNHFVSHGFAVVGMNFGDGDLMTSLLGAHDLINQDKNTDEVIAVLDWALADSLLAGKVDEKKIAVAGHSLGGNIAFFAASHDQRFSVVIGWDPQNAGGGSPCMINAKGCNAFPVAPNCRVKDPGILHEMQAESILFAARDAALMMDRHLWAEHFYRGAPSPTHMVLFPDAPHVAWGAPGSNATRITKRTQMALLLSRFKGVTGLHKYLPGSPSLDTESIVGEHSSK